MCLLLTALSSAHVFAETTFNYHGGAGMAGLPGPHAITSMTSDVGSSDMHYDANGDLVEVTGDMTLCQDYSVIRKPKRHSKEARRTDGTCRGATSVEILYTTTGEKLAVLSEGTLDVFMGNGVRVTNGKARLTYAGSAEESESGELLYRAKDHLGSIVAVANKQQILQRMDYLPYGEIWYSDIDGFTDRDFNGNLKQNDLLDYNARHYHPTLGKFLQADSVIPKVDTVGFNRYAYVSNNPLNRIDPSGHADEEIVRQIDLVAELPKVSSSAIRDLVMRRGVPNSDAARMLQFATNENLLDFRIGTASDFVALGSPGASGFYVPGSIRYGQGLIALRDGSGLPGKEVIKSIVHETSHTIDELHEARGLTRVTLYETEFTAHTREVRAVGESIDFDALAAKLEKSYGVTSENRGPTFTDVFEGGMGDALRNSNYFRHATRVFSFLGPLGDAWDSFRGATNPSQVLQERHQAEQRGYLYQLGHGVGNWWGIQTARAKELFNPYSNIDSGSSYQGPGM